MRKNRDQTLVEGGGTPPLVKHKTISHYFFWKASLGEYCKFCKNIIIKCAIYSLLLHLKILHVHSLKKRSNKVTLQVTLLDLIVREFVYFFKWTLSIQKDISPEIATINTYLKSKSKYLKTKNHFVYFVLLLSLFRCFEARRWWWW